MSKVLLLGPGRSRSNLSGVPFSKPFEGSLHVIDMDPDVRGEWDDAKFYKYDLRYIPWPTPKNYFDEVHGYELFNLLGGDEEDFFYVWREVHDALVPGGQVYASVPHWQSKWIHAYPALQRVYTPELLAHLDHDANLAHMSGFSRLWPKEYNFRIKAMYDVGRPPQGFRFILEKA